MVAGLQRLQAPRQLLTLCTRSHTYSHRTTIHSAAYLMCLLHICNRNKFVSDTYTCIYESERWMTTEGCGIETWREIERPTGHAESLYISQRDPMYSFSSRAKKTNKASPPPTKRSEVPIARRLKLLDCHHIIAYRLLVYARCISSMTGID